MSLWRLLDNWRKGRQRKNKKFHYISGEPLTFQHLDLLTQETSTRETQRSLAEPLPIDPYDDLQKRWNKMSRRERDVTALTCLGFTNRQIAARLGISVNTVNTHVVRVLTRFDLSGKPALQVLFANWDFSAWDRRDTQR